MPAARNEILKNVAKTRYEAIGVQKTQIPRRTKITPITVPRYQ
ncbi:MAG: hypothetical protein ACJAWX_002843 [Algoriphagus sp.]